MLIYVAMYLCSFVLTWVAENKKKQYSTAKSKKNLAIFILCVVGIYLLLTAFSCFRYGIGYDYLSEERLIRFYIGSGFEPYRKEALNIMLMEWIKATNMDVHFFFVFYALFTNAAFLIAIFICRDNRFIIRMFVYLFYALYISSMNQVRQHFGIALGMLAVSIALNYRGFWYGVLSFLIASVSFLSHYSEVVNLLFLLFIYVFRNFNKHIKMKYLIYICIGCVVFAPMLLEIVRSILLHTKLLYKYAGYISSNDNSALDYIRFFGSLYIFIIPVIYLIYFIDNMTSNSDYFSKLVFVYIAASLVCMFGSLVYNNLMLADRTRTMLYGLELFVFPYMVSYMEKRKKFSFKYAIPLLMIVMNLGTLFVGKMYPYRTIFNKDLLIY